MNPSNFIEALRFIGYPKADSLDPASFEWAFEYESTRSFLTWFCTSIREENYVSADEIAKYKAIQDSGEALTGARLEEVISALKLDKTESETECLESDVKNLKEYVARAKTQKNILKARCNKLSNHHMSMCNKIAKMEEVKQNEEKTHQKLIDSCRSENEKIANILHSLAENVQKIMNLYSSAFQLGQGEGQIDEAGPFLSQCDLKAFHEAEEWFARDLTTFIKKQFFEGIADMTGERDKDNYVLVDVVSPGQGPLKDDSSFLENCQEFSRLQQIFPKSECNRINAWINASKALSAVNEARAILDTLKSNQFPTSATEISRLHHIAEQDIETAKAQASSLVSSVPDLLRELGGLQGTEILTGDYDLKLQRQDYFINKQDEVIEQLVRQRARNEFLIMLYELESRYHKETHYLLSAARKLLEESLQAWQQRMKALEDPDLSVKKLERSVVDTRDKSSARLFHLLGDSPGDDKMLFLPKQKIVEKAKTLNSLYNKAKMSDETMDEKYLTKVSQLDDCVKDCMSALYAGSSTCAGIPQLIPPEIQAAMTSLTSMIEKLEADLSVIVADVNNKKMKLKNNLLLGKERELYILFHTNPSRLQYVVNGLADRLRAQEVK